MDPATAIPIKSLAPPRPPFSRSLSLSLSLSLHRARARAGVTLTYFVHVKAESSPPGAYRRSVCILSSLLYSRVSIAARRALKRAIKPYRGFNEGICTSGLHRAASRPANAETGEARGQSGMEGQGETGEKI